MLSGLGCVDVMAQALPNRQPAPPMPPPATQPVPMSRVAVPPAQPPLESYIAFDAVQKEVTVTNGTSDAHFTFNLTNISSGDVTINYVQPSCSCTVAKLPSQPWKIAPKEGGQISATMGLSGVPPGGSKTKTLYVSSDKGNKTLLLKATVVAPPSAMTEEGRAMNQKMAMADRQTVFKGDCVRCHVDPAQDAAGNQKTGKDLYAAVCGVCHEAEHQASFVPNLRHLPQPTNREFWKNWITYGKPGTLMPAFAKSEGGILSDAQIDSLVAYLTATIPPKPTAQNTVPPGTMVQ